MCYDATEQYRSKIDDLVSDASTYEQLPKDPTPSFTRKVREALKAVETKGNLSRGQYLQLYPSDPLPPLFYGLPKVHKPGVPMRPIVSTVGSVTYHLAKHLSRILTPLVGQTPFHIKDSKDFVKFERTVVLAEDDVMVSFDVQSLFMGVPTDLACEVAKKRLEAEEEKGDSAVLANTSMDIDDILLLLRLCLDTTYFQVNGKFYKQKRGTAMGSPVSVVVADLFMEEIDQRTIHTFVHTVRV